MLIFSYHAVKGSVFMDLLLCVGIGIGAIFSGHNAVIQLFAVLAAGSAPYIVMMKTGGIAKWEQYQLSMPIKRKHLATILYLNVLIAALMMLPIIGAVWGVGFIFNAVTVETIVQGLGGISFIYGSVLLMAALLYTLGCTRLGGQNESGLFIVCIVIAVAAVYAISVAGHAIGLTSGIISLLIIAITGLAFVAALFITKAMYAKMDF